MDAVSPAGWMCLAPPILTIVLAIVTRRVVVSLLVGIALGCVLLLPTPAAHASQVGQPVTAIGYVAAMAVAAAVSLATHLWASLIDIDHIYVYAFTALLGMQVALIHLAGGMFGIVRWATPWARSRRGGQIMTWLLGMVIFIDDYANTLLLGSTMRPLTDRLRISREKLAFLVDSTSAPVSGLALVSTWVATEISLMQTGFIDAGIDVGNGTFGLFVQTIPTRFYVLYVLVFVFLCGWMCRDFGPMLQAERDAHAHGVGGEDVPVESPARPRAMNAILPICVTVAVVVGCLIATGLAAQSPGEAPAGALQYWGQVVGQGDSYVSLLYGGLAGLLVVLALIGWQRVAGRGAIVRGLIAGFLHVLPAMVILWLAWTLSGLTGKEHLRTGEFFAMQVSQFNVPAGLLPTMIFVMGAGISFATGTSWGTMAILMPIAIPLVHGVLTQQFGEPQSPDHFIMLASIAGVLAGSIFGDHCSPISDTTILSSRSSSCDHIAHVRTQVPYALAVAAIAILFGTLPVGWGVSPWIALPLGTLAMVLLLRVVGKKID